MITDTGQPACSPKILENIWTGPAACQPQPGLQKVSVIAYRGPTHGPSLGLLVTVSAAAQYPSRLSREHIEQLAKDAFAGRQ